MLEVIRSGNLSSLMVPVVMLAPSARLVAVVAVPVRLPTNPPDEVMMPLVLALKVFDKVTAKSTLPVPSKDTGEEVATSPETLKSLAVSNLVAVEATPVKSPVTLPLRFAVIVPALKLPELSL
jgi:hypothetical protein